MAEGFDLIRHRRYRRREIHLRWGGQQQGGISTPVSIPAVFVFSGPTGKRFGYDQDEGWQPDGTFQYTGEGQRGPMAFERGNKAVRDHAESGKDLYLFTESPPRRDRAVTYGRAQVRPLRGNGPRSYLGRALADAAKDGVVGGQGAVERRHPRRLRGSCAAVDPRDALRLCVDATASLRASRS